MSKANPAQSVSQSVLIILGKTDIIELQVSLQLNGFMFYDSAVVSIRVRPEALSGFLHPLTVLQLHRCDPTLALLLPLPVLRVTACAFDSFTIKCLAGVAQVSGLLVPLRETEHSFLMELN